MVDASSIHLESTNKPNINHFLSLWFDFIDVEAAWKKSQPEDWANIFLLIKSLRPKTVDFSLDTFCNLRFLHRFAKECYEQIINNGYGSLNTSPRTRMMDDGVVLSLCTSNRITKINKRTTYIHFHLLLVWPPSSIEFIISYSLVFCCGFIKGSLNIFNKN